MAKPIWTVSQEVPQYLVVLLLDIYTQLYKLVQLNFYFNYADSEEYEQVGITVDGVHELEMNTSEPEPFEENEDPQFAMSVSIIIALV